MGNRCQGAMRLTGVVLVALAGLSGTAAAKQEQAGSFSLTIHRWLCPVDFASESTSACHQNPLRGGVFILDGAETRVGMTDPDGMLTFPDLGDGDYTVQVLPYGESHEPPTAYCGTGPSPRTRDPLTRVARDAFSISLSEDTDCNWYEFPVSGLPSDVQREGVPIAVFRCGSDPIGIGTAMTDYPGGCARIIGVAITVEAQDGSSADTCVTSTSGNCVVHGVPEYAVLTVDESTLPDGLALVANPISVHIYTEFASAYFYALPEGVAPFRSGESPGRHPRLQLSAMVCSDGSPETDIDRCRITPVPDFRFEVWQADNPGTLRAFDQAGLTSDAGVASFNTVGYGAGSLRIIGASPRSDPEGYVVADVLCATDVGDGLWKPITAEPLRAEQGTTVEVREIPFTPGDGIRCDWYLVPR